MTPFEINLLLHIYTTPNPPNNLDLPLTKDTLLSFMENGLIINEGDNLYTVTKRGSAHVNQLCQLPYPVLVWADKNGDIIEENGQWN